MVDEVTRKPRACEAMRRRIISPILADHVRREPVKFIDELERNKET